MSEILEELNVEFDAVQNTSFIMKVASGKNEKAKRFILDDRIIAGTHGVRCGACKNTHPLYLFCTDSRRPCGLSFDKCILCRQYSFKTLLKPLTHEFDIQLFSIFIDRIHESNNTNAKVFIESNKHNIPTHGFHCSICNETKPIYCFTQQIVKSKIGFRTNNCTKCLENNRDPYKLMLKRMLCSSKRRKHKDPELTSNDLKQLFHDQGGKCAYSGVTIFERDRFENDPQKMSPERLDNSIFYAKGNVVLICVGLQVGHGHDFNRDDLINLFSLPEQGPFSAVIFHNYVRKKRMCVEHNPIKNGYKVCNRCDKNLPVHCFQRNLGFCRECREHDQRKLRNTPYGFIKGISKSALSHSIIRAAQKRRNDKSGEAAKNLFKLFVAIITKQNGRCAITGQLFVYESGHRFAPSPDRIDNSQGYIEGNVRFIISPLNTAKGLNEIIITALKQKAEQMKQQVFN